MHRMHARVRSAVLSSALALAGSAGLAKADFSYFFLFGEPTDVVAQGSTTYSNGNYELTTGEGQGSALWHDARQSIAGGFVCFVRFSIQAPQGDPQPEYIPGDGFALVVSGATELPIASTSTGGSGLGYEGFPQSVAFEIDTFGFGGEFESPHASIQVPDAEPLSNSDDQSVVHQVLANLAPPIDVLDMREHTLVVQYVPPLNGDLPLLQMWIDERLVVSTPTDLSDFADENGTAWIGLTAGTGLANSVHQIMMWDFRQNTGACAEPRWFGAYTGSGCVLPSGPCGLSSGVSVSGSRPLEFRWYRDGAQITDDENGRITGLQGNELVVNDVTSNDHANYEVRFENACGASNFGPNFIATGLNCNSVDFNNDQLFPDSSDLDDYLAVLGGGPSACSTGDCDPLDFNNDELFPDALDLDAFLSRLSGGPCLRE